MVKALFIEEFLNASAYLKVHPEHTGKILDSQFRDKIVILLGICWVMIGNSQNWESATKPILGSKKSHLNPCIGINMPY